jgi:hypothetical protein
MEAMFYLETFIDWHHAILRNIPDHIIFDSHCPEGISFHIIEL